MAARRSGWEDLVTRNLVSFLLFLQFLCHAANCARMREHATHFLGTRGGKAAANVGFNPALASSGPLPITELMLGIQVLQL